MTDINQALKDAPSDGEIARVNAAINNKEDNTQANQATKIFEMVEKAGAALRYALDYGAYLTIEVTGHIENILLEGGVATKLLTQMYYKQFGKVPQSQAVKDSIKLLSAKAEFEGERVPLEIRNARQNEIIYVDLMDKERRVVEITSQGWRVISANECPINFLRPLNSLPLPKPVPNGNINSLKEITNLATTDDLRLAVTFLLNCLNPNIPYFIMIINGDHGSAKSTFALVLKNLIDPSKPPLRSLPKSEQDLVIAGLRARVLAFDNVSTLNGEMSDAFCRLSTGGGHGTRTLFTNTDETLIDVRRPVIMNGILEFVTKPDLIDRGILLHLPPIQNDKRMEIETYWKMFEEIRPQLLGALYNGLAAALRNQSTVVVEDKPRMVDSIRWATAATEGLGWESSVISHAYSQHRKDLNELVLELSPIYQPIKDLVHEQGEWEGTAKELLEILIERTSKEAAHRKEWPKSPRGMSAKIRTIAPNLRFDGIEVELDKRSNDSKRRRLILLRDRRSTDQTDQSSNFGQSDGSDDHSETQSSLDIGQSNSSRAYH